MVPTMMMLRVQVARHGSLSNVIDVGICFDKTDGGEDRRRRSGMLVAVAVRCFREWMECRQALFGGEWTSVCEGRWKKIETKEWGATSEENSECHCSWMTSQPVSFILKAVILKKENVNITACIEPICSVESDATFTLCLCF